ncbi:MAG: AMP-binding protein [Vulcanimicrobiaceae bacterium]
MEPQASATTLDRLAAAYPQREALVCAVRRIRLTCRELAEETDRLARGLIALGVERGDALAIWAYDGLERTVALFAGAKLGVRALALDPSSPASVVAGSLKRSGARLLFAAVRGADDVEMLRRIVLQLDALQTIVLIGDGELERPLTGALRWTDVTGLAAASVTPEHLSERAACVRGAAEDPAVAGMLAAIARGEPLVQGGAPGATLPSPPASA